MEDIIAPIDKEILKSELTQERRLRFTNKSHNEIYVVTAHNAPNVMKEVGRLREIAFRAAGGGTGKSMDIDEYDIMPNPYKQLIVWNPEAEDPEKWGETSVMIMDMGNDMYLFMGTGVVTTMSPADGKGRVGIERIDEISFDDYGKMQKIRRLNGDENHQGRHIRIPFGEYGAQLLKVYRY